MNATVRSAVIKRNEVVEMNIIKENPRIVYDDIIDMPHHQSIDRNHMSLYDRAAQFAPFAALVGYDEMVKEEARLTDSQTEISEDDRAILERKIGYIADEISAKRYPDITVEYFEPDSLKTGGKYLDYSGIVKKIDSVERKVVFFAENGILSGKEILISRLRDIHGEQIDFMVNNYFENELLRDLMFGD